MGLLLLSSRQKDITDSILWPDITIFYGLRDQLNIGLCNMVVYTVDWWVYDIMIFTSGIYGLE